MDEIKRTVKEVKLHRNALGWFNLFFFFEEGDCWSVTHLNEGFNFKILNHFFGCGDDLNTFVGNTVTLKCKYSDCLQDGIISFDRVDYRDKTPKHITIDIDKLKVELSEKYEEMHNAVVAIGKLKTSKN